MTSLNFRVKLIDSPLPSVTLDHKSWTPYRNYITSLEPHPPPSKSQWLLPSLTSAS